MAYPIMPDAPPAGSFASMVLVTMEDESWVEAVAAAGMPEQVELMAWDLSQPHPRADEIEIVVPPYFSSERTRFELLGDLPALQVVQLLSAGFDHIAPHVPDGVRLCNAATVHETSTAELALTLMLSSLRGIPEFVAAQLDSTWLPLRVWPALADKRVLVLGYGKIGRAIVSRLLPFEVTVTAVASRARAGDELVGQVHGIDELPQLLPEHDVVVVIVPLSPATTGLVDAGFLASMKDGALLVNVARGKVVDTDALLQATTSGRVRAALDVTDPEPLPPDHPLWHAPGVLVSPHTGGATTAMQPRAVALLHRQLDAYAAGRELENVVQG